MPATALTINCVPGLVIAFFQLCPDSVFHLHSWLATSHIRLELSHSLILGLLLEISCLNHLHLSKFHYFFKTHPQMSCMSCNYSSPLPSIPAQTCGLALPQHTTSLPLDMFIILPCVRGYLCMTRL